MTHTKMSKKRPAVIFVFRDAGGVEQKAGLTLDLAQAIPGIASTLEGTKSKSEYRYRDDITQKAMSTYFRSIGARTRGLEFNGFAELTPEDWNYVFWLAFRLGDTQFFEEHERFPDLMTMGDLILKMPGPARLIYFGHYIGRSFGYDCDCDRNRLKQLRQEARDWLSEQDPDVREQYEKTPVPGAFRKYKKQLTHTYDLDEKFKDDWYATNQGDIDAGQIFDWYDLDLEVKVHLVHLQIKLPGCACKRSFYDMWNTFCTMLPPVGDFLWTNMKRDELMRYAKTSDEKKDRTAQRKKSFEELCSYVEFTRDRR